MNPCYVQLIFFRLLHNACNLLIPTFYCIMGCYYTLCHNTYAFSLLFYKVYTKRENADSWNSGPERSKSERPILHSSKSPETLQRIILECIQNIG